MKTLYIFIAAGGPAARRAGGRAGGRGGRAAAAQCREAACPGGPGGRTRARVPPRVARRGGATGGVRGELPPPLGTRVWPGSRPRTSLRPLVPRGRPDPSRPAPGVRRATVGSASRPRATLGQPPSEGMSSGRRSAAPWVPVGRSPRGAGWRRRRAVAPAPLPDPPGLGARTPERPRVPGTRR